MLIDITGEEIQVGDKVVAALCNSGIKIITIIDIDTTYKYHPKVKAITESTGTRWNDSKKEFTYYKYHSIRTFSGPFYKVRD